MVIGFLKETVDGGLEINDRSENPAFEAAPGQLGEEALDGIEPGGGGRREMKHKPRMPGEPGANFGVLVGGVIVEHDVDILPTGMSASMVWRKRMNAAAPDFWTAG